MIYSKLDKLNIKYIFTTRNTVAEVELSQELTDCGNTHNIIGQNSLNCIFLPRNGNVDWVQAFKVKP